MFQSRKWAIRMSAAATATTLGVLAVLAQGGNVPVATTGDQVVIKREPSRVIDPQKFRVPLAIEAAQTVTLVAPFDGKVKQILLKTNAKGQAQAEVIRLDNTVQKLQLDRAQKLLKLATLKLKHADKDEAAAAIAQTEVDVAKIDVEIAQAIVDETGIRLPFAGEIQRVLVTEGQFVRAGEAVAVAGDTSKVKVEVPVDRASAEVGKMVTIKIEANEVEGKIDQVVPLPPKFDGLRDLFDSVASVQLVIDNADGRYKVGQTVYPPMIPRQPVVEVPLSSIGNLTDGHRKVQVVRQSFVRDVPVSLLGQVGVSRVFVSGPFAEGDEIIYETSLQLGDGFQLKAASGGATASSNPAPAQGNTTTPKPQVGF